MGKISDYLQMNRECIEKHNKTLKAKHKNKSKINKKKQLLYREGNIFEEYVITMFDHTKFDRIHRTPTYESTNGEFDPSMTCPDLGFKELSTGREFWVEVKFRSRTDYDSSFRFCDWSKFRKYKRARNKSDCPVFIIIGIGGNLDNPDNVYCLDLDRIKNTKLCYDAYAYNKVEGKIESLDQLFDVSQLTNNTKPTAQTMASKNC